MKILYFSTVNWKWIKQRPHFIAYYLSQQGHDVDYISLNPLGKTMIQKTADDRLNVLDSYVLPFALKFRLVEQLNMAYIKSRLAGRRYDIVILTSPMHYRYIPASVRAECRLVYECMDNIPYFYEGALRDQMLAWEQETLDIADGVIVSSDRLSHELQSRSPKKKLRIKTIYNAVDKKAFSRCPVTLELQEPNLLYIGTVDSWLDWDTIVRFAKEHPGYTIYLIGPLNTKKKLPANIQCLGPVPHHKVIDYISSGNVLLLPFKVNRLTEAVDPVKMYEYMALDKPVISSYWPELDKFKCANLYFYRGYEEFETHALRVQAKKAEVLNRDFLEEHNWDKRVYEYMEYLVALTAQEKRHN